MPSGDMLDQAISEATADPRASELMRDSRLYEELRASAAWQKLRDLVKERRGTVTRLLGEKALKGVPVPELRDEAVYSRGFLDGCEMLLERPDQIEQRLESLINESYHRLREEVVNAKMEESPYA